MQHAKTNEEYNQLLEIINETRSSYENYTKTKDEQFVKYPYMPLALMSDHITALDKASNNLSTSILEDIISINYVDTILGNIYQNLMRRTYAKFFNYSEEDFNKILILALKQKYYLLENIERKIRDIFTYFLREEIHSTDNQITRYYLSIIRQNIHFKYATLKEDEEQQILNTNSFIASNISSNKVTYFYKDYLDNLITSTIDALLGMSNDTLTSDNEYAKAICLQCLLRTVFIIIDDYKELIPYEEYYNVKEKKETVSKGMVRDAFIRHYNDSRNENLKMLVKKNYVKNAS